MDIMMEKIDTIGEKSEPCQSILDMIRFVIENFGIYVNRLNVMIRPCEINYRIEFSR